jgi:Helix-turn-helix domain
MDEMAGIIDRLNRIERLLLDQRTVKDWYTTSEVSDILDKSEYTVREWARLGRIRASKRACGRGRSKEWVVSHEELTRLQNEGLLPPRTAG